MAATKPVPELVKEARRERELGLSGGVDDSCKAISNCAPQVPVSQWLYVLMQASFEEMARTSPQTDATQGPSASPQAAYRQFCFRRSRMHINGSCHCGAITFTAEIDPSRVMVCHCTDCQVLSGSPFRAVVATPAAKFSVKGSPKSYIKVAQSGNRRAQVFCPECGTPLYACAPENPTSVVIRLGCVEQRAQLKPSVQIWRHSGLPWLPDLSSIPGSPEQQAFLPAPAQ